MSKRDELLALAERCEKESEGSRELDGLIWKAACEKPGDIWSRDLIDGNIWMRQDPEDTVAYEAPPAYTTSLDAAMTLVLGGWWLTLDRYSISDKAPDPFAWRVWLRRLVGDVDGDGTSFHQEKFARATTPALALCAAALRAAAEMEG